MECFGLKVKNGRKLGHTYDASCRLVGRLAVSGRTCKVVHDSRW